MMASIRASDMLDFYRSQSEITDPKTFARLYDSLPEAVGDIGAALNNVLLHTWKVHAQNLSLNPAQQADIEIRPVARLLERLQQASPEPWDRPRRPEDRVVVDCRHFATLLCSVLRHRGIPARTRHGFAAYLQPGHSQSHVICEYWDPDLASWRRADPDTLQHGMSPDQFVSADAAWRGIGAGEMDAAQFGYAPDIRGAWCVRWEMIRDFAAFNKHELLTFDIWGLNASYAYDEPLQPQAHALLDHIAGLMEDDRANFAALRTIYESDERVRVPAVIWSEPYTTGRRGEVDLIAEGSLLPPASQGDDRS